MIILHEVGLKRLMTQIVEATHGLTDAAGRPYGARTIDADTLRMAAQIAVQMAVGETVWPNDRKLVIEKRVQGHDIMEVKEVA